MPEQPLNLNENILNETQRPEGEKTGAGLDLAKSPEVTEIANDLEKIEEALFHDQTVTVESLESLEKGLGDIKVDVGGELMTLEEAEQIPNLKMNAKIWRGIRGGDYSYHSKLTYLPAGVAEILAGYQWNLSLDSLTTLSDQAAEHLSHKEGVLKLSGLTTISDVAAEHLSHHKGNLLLLNGLTTLSDAAAEHLSRHEEYVSLSDKVRAQVEKYKQK